LFIVHALAEEMLVPTLSLTPLKNRDEKSDVVHGACPLSIGIDTQS
jgi:hypothetical protein